MQQQPRADGCRGRQWADGAEQATEVIGIAEPALGCPFGTQPGEASPGDETGVWGQATGENVAVCKGVSQNLAGPGAGFQPEGNSGASQWPDKRCRLTSDDQAVCNQAARTGTEIKRP